MVEKFVGTWKMISSENFDDYMKAIGKRRVQLELACTAANCVVYDYFFLSDVKFVNYTWERVPFRHVLCDIYYRSHLQ